MPLTDEDFLANKENEEDVQLADKGENEQFTDMLANNTDLFEIFDDLPSVPITSHQATSSSEFSVSERFPSYIFKFRIEFNWKISRMLHIFAYFCFKVSKLSWEQLQRIEKNKRRAQELRVQHEKRMNQLNDFDSIVKNDGATVCTETVCNMPLTSKSFTQNKDSGKPEEDVDDMMDDNEALDFIFSST